MNITHIHRTKTLLIFVTTLALLSVRFIYAQQLLLPDETIIGFVEMTPDSLDLKVDISEYNRMSNQDKLTYKPQLNKKLPLLNYKRYNIFAQATGNTSSFIDFKLGLESHSIPELNIFTGYHFFDYIDKNEDFKSYNWYVNWEPMVNYSSLRIKPAFYIKESKYKINEETLPDVEASIEYGMVSTRASFTSAPIALNPLSNLNLSGEHHSLSILPDIEKKETKDFIEFDAFISFTDIGFISEIEGSTHRKFENFQAESNVFFKVPFLDLLGANIQISKKLYPSLYVTKNIFLTNYVELSIANQPFIDTKSIRDYYEYYPFGSLEKIKHAPQTPLNLLVSFSLFSPFETRISYNVQYTENYIYYGIKGLVEDPEIDWCQDQVKKNIWMLELQKKINDLRIKFKSEYIVSDFTKKNDYLKHIPWEPHFVNSLSAEYFYKKFTFYLSNELLLQRYSLDGKDKTLHDAFKTVCAVKYNINKNVGLFGSINNVFSDEYRIIADLPKEKFSAEAGVRMQF